MDGTGSISDKFQDDMIYDMNLLIGVFALLVVNYIQMTKLVCLSV